MHKTLAPCLEEWHILHVKHHVVQCNLEKRLLQHLCEQSSDPTSHTKLDGRKPGLVNLPRFSPSVLFPSLFV